MWKSVDEACAAVVRVAKTVNPQPAAVGVMNESYAAFRRVYPVTKTIFSA
jgi:xylulokinase